MGFDSLLLTQVGKELNDTFKVKVSLRQLIDEFSTIAQLTSHLEANTSETSFSEPAPQVQQAAPQAYPQGAMPQQFPPFGYPVMPGNGQQMPIAYIPVVMPWPNQAQMPQMPVAPVQQASPQMEEVAEPVKPSGPVTVIERADDSDKLTSKQKEHIDRLVFRYTEKTAKSKELTRKYRKFHADPRTASGFNRMWKEMVYQIVTTKSKGSRLLDVDGNEYIDILNGFGPGFLGHSADFLVEAVENQLHEGYEVGPQSLLAMEAAELFCEVTGNERTSFVCTGSEAVQAAMRLARTVTKRDKIVIFARDYHGNFDEVLVRGVNRGGNLKSLPTAPGIPKESAGNMIVLPYGTDESLEIIRNMADELAAIIVEPVQSRRPEFRPKNFIREVRDITSRSGTLFVFDEVVTGFRFGPRGAQEFYGVEADLCTYGKVIGGGMPLGVVSGKAEYMDTFDGGMWEYGDDSFPEQPVTFFAGTFVRHPLAMASVKAMLEFFQSQPPHFWNQVNAKGDKLAGTVNTFFRENNFPIEMPNCGSLMFVRMGENQKYGNLFFYHLREKGIFMLEGFPSYMTAAHSDEDIDYTIAAFKESAREMQDAGFFGESIKNEFFDGPVLFGPPAQLASKETTERKISQTADSAKKFLAPLTVPTTEPQREVLVASRLNERSSCAFNESASLRFKGSLNVTALEKAFATLVARHDALRCTFSDDGLTMTVNPQLDIPIEKIDLTGKEAEHLDAILHVDASTPYQLDKGPLVRPMLVQLNRDEYNFVISAHHLVCDGWSYNVIAEELCELYNAECENRTHKLPRAKQYADHAREMESKSKDKSHNEQKEYWLNQFSTVPEPLELPLDRPYQIDRTYHGATLEYRIGKDTYEAVKKAGAKYGSTLYSTLAAAFQLMIHRLTGQEDVVICIPAAGQNDGENTDQLIGHCVNFLPLRSRYDSKESFDSFLSQSRKTLLAATDNRSYTYGELIQELDLERDPRRLPLLEVAFNVERMDYFGEWRDLDVVFEPNGKTHVHYTMFMNIVESVNGLRIDVDYNTDLLDESTVLEWIKGFEALLQGIAENPVRKCSQLPVMNREQITQVLHQWNSHSNAGCFPEKPVHTLFEELANGDPDAIALVDAEGSITYRELNDQANSVAAYLKKIGVGSGDFIAVMANRSPEIVAGLLGILKTGAAYVPVDPSYPADRVAVILKDSAPAVLLKDDEVKYDAGKAVPTLSLQKARSFSAPEDFQPHQGNSDDIAYVIYTSGSTGTPKGTLIPHRGIVRLVRNTDYINFGPEETFLLSAPISFDASTLELWGPLLNGGKLALMPPGTPGLADIGDAIEKFGVTTLWLTSGLFSLMVDEHPECLAGLKQLLAGGDVLSPAHVEKALDILGESGTLINGYGPTENTTFTTCHTIGRTDTKKNSIPIGKPIAHTQCYILDENMQPVPPGVKGRLYIGGDGLAIGYLNQPEFTLKKFIPTPLSEFSDERLYDSGDRCSWLKNGTIEFHGRADRQIKLRGFRIEPGEIENVLHNHPDVNEAVVRVTGSNATDKKLIGYVTPSEDVVIDPKTLTGYLANSLPSYMVPSELVVVSKFPVTANGKVDYEALPLPAATSETAGAQKDSTPPESPTEKTLARLWDEVLQCGAAGVNDNFFTLGGHSLAGLKLFTRIHKEFGVNLPLATLFQAPTIQLLSEIIDKHSSKSRVQIVTRASQGSPNETPLFLIHGGDGGTLIYKKFIEEIEGYGEIYTIEAPMIVDRCLEKTEETIEDTAVLYRDYIREIYDGGSFAFGGYSFGGVIAYELARQIREQGNTVEKLFLFDTNNPANEEQYKNNLATWARTGWEQTEGTNFLEKLSNSRERLEKKIQNRTELRKAKLSIRELEKGHRKMEDDMLRVTLINEMHHHMMNNYEPKPYDGETWLFRAEATRFSFDREMGWRDLIPNLTVSDIKGEHQEIFDPPNVDVLIRKFNEALSLYV
ncbi:MAG: amino acid adenylation domain-containing protein [Verrucomicrobiales bacterium]|nr:amino acid adenylation domain-containing protein [Verrucomicrobiales bacterium]